MRKFLCALGLFSIFILITPLAMPQSLTSGDISGTVSDPSGAVIKDAVVNLKSLDTGAAQTTATGDNGLYRFSLLKPGRYSLKVTQQGFQGSERQVHVNIGQITTANFTLAVGKATEIVEVTGALPIVNTESANLATAYDQREVSTLPNPAGDLTNIAQIAPGVVMNTSSVYGYGNFTANGLPGTANVFTVNGENDMDPQFNINNSGATNLMLGSNEMQEATVVSNPYSGQYGQQAGAQVNYVTKSGTNTFHGNAQYMWNGRAMNANDWFANNSNTPRPFANNNQWAASFGGPIQKDKTFFFVNYEGLRFLLPTVQNTYIPTQAFANATLANLASNPETASSVPLYQKLFNVWLNAPGAQRATPLAGGGCDDAVGVIPGITANTTCVNNFIATPGALSTEWILGGRVDHNFSDNDKVFGRYRMDRGLQATYTDPINSAFNATSSQPSYDGQLQWNHILSGNATNQFIMAGSYYTAIFKQDEAKALATFPFDMYFYSPMQFTFFGDMHSFPQGRNVTQYQLIDDFSVVRGSHTFKIGVNFRRYDISDYNFQFYKNPRAYFDSMADFASGNAYDYRQSFPQHTVYPMAFFGLGAYAQDEWQTSNKLKLTFALRLEHNSNPVCPQCVVLLNGPFDSIAHGANVPYNQSIQTGLGQAYPSSDPINVSPRFGFTWSPSGSAKTVISGGFGIFYDAIAASTLETFATNVPNINEFRIYNTKAPVYWADPGTNGGPAIAAASNQAFLQGFASGLNYNQIKALVPNFRAPVFYNAAGTFNTPRFQEWNLQVQQAIGANMSASLNYVGNHGIHVPVYNDGLNAYDPYSLYAGFPSEPADPRFSSVAEYATRGVSNYNGLTANFQRRFANHFSAGASYTWSHALDEVSNGGVTPYALYDSLQLQLNPLNLRANNYGNADYDVRHYFSLWYDWQPSLKFSNGFLNQALNGWVFSGKLFDRTGMPFTVLDGNGYLGNYPLATPPAQPIGAGAAPGQLSCSTPNSACLSSAAFVDTASTTLPGFPTQRRNQYRGAGFFDTDFAVVKNFKLHERMNFGVGATFYNLFNHPNFAFPDYYLGDSTFGQMLSTVSVPASPYGAFMGSAAAPRLIQLNAKITF